MRITEISVSVGRTTNLGNYETMRNEVTVGGSLGPDEDFDEQAQDLYSLAELELLDMIKKATTKLSRDK